MKPKPIKSKIREKKSTQKQIRGKKKKKSKISFFLLELYGFSDDATPAFVERSLHDGVVGTGWTRPDHERIRHFEAIHGDAEIRLRVRGGRDLERNSVWG